MPPPRRFSTAPLAACLVLGSTAAILGGCESAEPTSAAEPSDAKQTAAEAPPAPPPAAAGAPAAATPTTPVPGDVTETVDVKGQLNEELREQDAEDEDEREGSRGVGSTPKAVPPTKRTPDKSFADADGDTLLNELTRLEGKLGDLGVAVTHAPNGAIAASDLDRNASLGLTETGCKDVCTVTESICSLSTRICALADGHGDDDRYARACVRATTDCGVGTAACKACQD